MIFNHFKNMYFLLFSRRSTSGFLLIQQRKRRPLLGEARAAGVRDGPVNPAAALAAAVGRVDDGVAREVHDAPGGDAEDAVLERKRRQDVLLHHFRADAPAAPEPQAKAKVQWIFSRGVLKRVESPNGWID